MVLKKTLFTVCIMLLNIGFAGAATLNVGQGQAYATIQSAVDTADTGDVILVNEGTYFENVVVKKNGISIVGKDKERTIIDAKKTGSGIKLDMANNIKISGFTIQNSFGSGKEDAGISVYSSNNNMIGNTIIINNAVGIALYKDSGSSIISGNNLKSNGYGISIYSSNDNKISNNNIEKNKIGIYIDTSKGNQIYANNFMENSESQAYDNSGSNSWDDGKSGNYWSSYKGGSGFTITGPPKAKDNYPLSGAVAIKSESIPLSAEEKKAPMEQAKAGEKTTPGFLGISVAVSIIALMLFRKKSR